MESSRRPAETPSGAHPPVPAVPPALDLAGWVRRHAAGPRELASGGRWIPRARALLAAADVDLERRTRRASAYLARLPGAVSGQRGHDRTFHAACVLIKGFDLTVDAGPPPPEGMEPGLRAPVVARGARAQAEKRRGRARRPAQGIPGRRRAAAGYGLPPGRPRRPGPDRGSSPAGRRDVQPPGPIPSTSPNPGASTSPGASLKPFPKRHFRRRAPTARRPIRIAWPPSSWTSGLRSSGEVGLRFWREEFHEWDGSAYRRIPTGEMRAELAQFLAREFERLYRRELAERNSAGRPGSVPRRRTGGRPGRSP